MKQANGKRTDVPYSSNISTDVICLSPDVIPSRLRQPRLVLETRVAAQELIYAEIKARVVDVQLVLARRIRGAETRGWVPCCDALGGEGVCWFLLVMMGRGGETYGSSMHR
jgi:hypothetical protein